MSRCPTCLLVVTAALSDVTSSQTSISANPNRVTQSLIAVARRPAGSLPMQRNAPSLLEELVAAYLYQVHLYHWLESNDYGRFLADNDL
jgi:hypothetical protein